MDPQSWAPDRICRRRAGAARAASRLRRLGAAIELVPPQPGLPDYRLTANAAVVYERTALLALSQRRRGAKPPGVPRSCQRAGRSMQCGSPQVSLEARHRVLIARDHSDGFCPRSDAAAQRVVADQFGLPVIALELADPRFYHMDTALSVLPGGEVMHVPGAFTAAGRAAIRDRVGASTLIEIGDEDAAQLAANTVCLGNALVMSGCSERLRATLAERGYRVHTTPLPSFLRSGGSAFCLTLRLDLRAAGATSAAAA